MTLGPKRRRAHDKLAALPGVRSVRRPVTTSPAELFDLFYIRTGERSAHPLVVIPGGPGVASIGHYRGLRRRAAASGLDVIMVEHRGVGMSRHDDAGADLPPAALTVEQVVDDIAAVLDDADVHQAVIYGTSYGSYLAAGLGVRHPGRVHAMILDSPLLNQDDIEIVRRTLRGMFWHGDDPRTADLAAKVRRLADRGAMTPADERIADLVPAAVLVRLPTAGHSVLDTRETAAVRIAAAVCSGAAADLAGRGVALDNVPARPAMRAVGAAVEAAVRIEAVLPRFAQPRSDRRAIS
jgi:pimeloyl-ACP methyl ester carboxylesterase